MTVACVGRSRAWSAFTVTSIPDIFRALPECYRSGVLTQDTSFYFSVGEHKYTVRLTPDRCEVDPGKTLDQADVVLKTTPELFIKMVVQGGTPSTLDVIRGRVKTNAPGQLKQMRDLFDFTGV